jgi:osmotically-inducible protein OsmY
MKRFNITALAAAIALAFSAGAMAADSMPKADYKAAQARIAAEYKSARANCDALASNAKDVCILEAKGSEKIAKAELEARNHPNDRTRYAASIAKAEADYAVAKEKCDDRKGAEKTACVKEAKAVEARAKAETKDAQLHASKPAKTASAAPASKKESPGEYFDDAVITTKVKAAVLEEPSLKSAEINVETLKGTVQLTGFVNSRADIDKAVQVAKSVKGVKSVKNDMILKGKG